MWELHGQTPSGTQFQKIPSFHTYGFYGSIYLQDRKTDEITIILARN
jgi:hypothetical protein